MWCRHAAYSEWCKRKRISIIRIILGSWQFAPSLSFSRAHRQLWIVFSVFSKVIAPERFAYRETGDGYATGKRGRANRRAEARKLSNIEIKFISWHQKQLPLVLRVCEIGDILKFPRTFRDTKLTRPHHKKTTLLRYMQQANSTYPLELLNDLDF